MIFNDLREFLKKAEELGLVNPIEGADWDVELGRIVELQVSVPDAPSLLFDKIKGYEAGYRVMTGYLSGKLLKLVMELPLEATGVELAEIWREKIKSEEEFKPAPPVEVETGPVMENVHIGDEVDLFEFPTPKWHELDGGRYIGTGCLVIQRDPDEGWINLATYRVQVHDKTTATIFISPGKHGDIIRRKYWDKGMSCPVAVACGVEPLLLTMGATPIPWGISEYDYVGGLRKKPLELVRGKTTDLLIPAGAEIVLEGEILPPGVDERLEGPFGEYTGYYASGAREETAFKVKAVLHRDDPIITGSPPLVGVVGVGYKYILDSAVMWNELDKRVPGIKGVWRVPAATGWSMTVISLKQMYAGHAKTAALLAAGLLTEAEAARWIIVVDDDIDPSNIGDVLWALGQRCDPAVSIDIIKGCCTNPLNPMVPPWERSRENYVHSRAIVLACRPYDWIKEFPPSTKSSPEALRETRKKWGKLLYGQA